MTTTADMRARAPRLAGAAKRILYGLSGGALALYGLRKRGLAGTLLAVAGGGVMWNGLAGSSVARKLITRVREQEVKEIRIERSLVIARSPIEVYRAFRDFERLPRIFRHVAEVKDLGGGRLYWKANVHAGSTVVEWDAEIIEDKEGEVVSWRSLPGGAIEMNGGAYFTRALGFDGTLLRLDILYKPAAAGTVNKVATRLLNRAVEEEVKEDLRRFKAVLEAGEVPTVEGEPHGGKRRNKAGPTWMDRVGGRS